MFRRPARAAAAFLFSLCACSALDLRNAAIVLPAGASRPQQKAAQMLSEEIARRTQVRLTVQPSASGLAIRLVRDAAVANAEGYSITAAAAGVTIAGHDDRGVLFGAGRLLRELKWARQRVELPDGFHVVSSPRIPVRGHQLGYRPKTNSYDAWDIPMWEQYIRELAIFGTNTVELIPPRSDDDADSPHFPLPQIEMMEAMSRICDDYGLDVSIWYPALDKDYSDPATVERAVAEWADVFKRLPRIDAVFVPGGDPGHTQPKYMMALLEKQAASLHRLHPKATLWVAPQGFTRDWMDEFLTILRTEPRYLTGVVFGPQNRLSVSDLRAAVPQRYPIRLYPDITHSITSQYPVPQWDAAFALTEGREVINPRPLDETAIFHDTIGSSVGFVTYSEGCNDDVNKFVWSGLGWDPQSDVRSILTEYARWFIGDESFANTLLALEANWRGPLAANSSVDQTLAQLESMERASTPQLRGNWRFQQVLYRAYYDAYLRSRLIAETAQQEAAYGELAAARARGSLAAITAAEAALDADRRTPRTLALRARVFELAEALFNSVRMQLSVPRYRAIALGRGANLDAIDFSLNDRVWLKERFAEIRGLTTEPERLEKIRAIVEWTNPGPGGYYDDLGNPALQPHVVAGPGFDKDPEARQSSYTGFGGRIPDQGWRMSWYTTAGAMFDAPLRLSYEHLDRAARYKVRVVYAGDTRVPVRMTANGTEIHAYREKPLPPTPLEFELAPAVTAGGTLALEFTRSPGLGGAGRGAQVAEVWLVRLD